jgi:hypothetical protein
MAFKIVHFFLPIALVTEFNDTAEAGFLLCPDDLPLVWLVWGLAVPPCFAIILTGRIAAIEAKEAVRILLMTAVPGLAPLIIAKRRSGVRV